METKESTTNKIFRWVQANYGYSNILMGTFVALWLKIFFRKYDFNFFEILILLCFVMGMGMFILSVFAIIQGLTHLKVLQFGASALFIYLTWAIGQFFDGKKILSYLKALFAYILGMSTLWILIFITGAIIDKFIKP